MARLLVLRTSGYNQAMTERAQAILRDAMSLSADERANVAAELLASPDDSVPEDPAAVQAAWAKEIERRARRVLAGESAGQSWDDVRDRVRRHLTQR